VVNLNKA